MTSVRAHLPAYGTLHALRSSSVRVGLFVGLSLSIAFSAWVVVANRVPSLDGFAFMRNWAAAALLGLLASTPVLLYWRTPGNLLASSLVGWLLFSVTYRTLGIAFRRLDDRISAVQVFMLGAVIYLLIVTLSWIGTIVRRARLE